MASCSATAASSTCSTELVSSSTPVLPPVLRKHCWAAAFFSRIAVCSFSLFPVLSQPLISHPVTSLLVSQLPGIPPSTSHTMTSWSEPVASSLSIHQLSSMLAVSVTLGCTEPECGRIKGNQATFDNSQRNNLRSCVWVSVVVF